MASIDEVWRDPATGRLYLAGGVHRPFDHALGRCTPTATSFENFAANLARRTVVTSARGIVYRHFVFPDKHTVELDTIEGQVPVSLIEAYRARSPTRFLDPVALLRKQEQRTYYATDSHWNGVGRIVASRHIARALGIPLREVRPWVKAQTATIYDKEHHVGDLGSGFDPPLGAPARRLRPRRHVLWTGTELANGKNEGVIRVGFNPRAPDRTLLIFGDSFAESTALPLSGLFRVVIFLRTRHLHDEMLDLLAPTHVVTSNVERYLSNVVSDEQRPAFLTIPFHRDRSVAPKAGFGQLFSGLMSRGRPPFYAEMANACLACAAPKLARRYVEDGLARYPGDGIITRAARAVDAAEMTPALPENPALS